MDGAMTASKRGSSEAQSREQKTEGLEGHQQHEEHVVFGDSSGCSFLACLLGLSSVPCHLGCCCWLLLTAALCAYRLSRDVFSAARKCEEDGTLQKVEKRKVPCLQAQ